VTNFKLVEIARHADPAHWSKISRASGACALIFDPQAEAQ
jgi:hypothetical protein